MSKTVDKHLLAIAYHEAGHAIASYVLKKRFGAISIVPDKREGDRPEGVMASGSLTGSADKYKVGHITCRTQESGAFACDLGTKREREKLLRQCAVAMAGIVAENIKMGGDPLKPYPGQQPIGRFDDGTPYYSDILDQNQIQELMADLSIPEQFQNYMDRATRKVTSLLINHWRAVEALAETVLEEKTTSGARARSIIADYVSAPKSLKTSNNKVTRRESRAVT